MIDLKTLKEIGKLKNLKNLGYMDKDYIQEILLLIIYRNFNFLIFKGGTCLYKLHKLNRFSEDLDFSAIREFNLDNFLQTLKNGLERFNISVNKVIHKTIHDSILIRIRAEGVLYSGSPVSLCTVRIDINLKSKVLDYHLLNLKSFYPDIPSFDILAMSPKEILAEKVRAILTRNKARDVYDLWFLIKEKAEIDSSLIEQKLCYYKKKFNLKEFEKHLNLRKNIWETELNPLIQKIPSFKEAKKLILEEFRKERS